MPRRERRSIAVWGLVSLVFAGCPGESTTEMGANDGHKSGDSHRRASLSDETIASVQRFCGDCHPLPSPATFPKDRWEEEVIQGYDFYIASGRTDLIEPSREDAIRYFRDLAPERLLVPRADAAAVESALPRFTLASSAFIETTQSASVSHIVASVEAGCFYSADMEFGAVHRWKLNEDGEWTAELIFSGRHSCRLTPCDWNGDKIEDLLVGEIGSYGVGDHQNGRVSLLLGNAEGGFTHSVLADRLARVVEAQPMDFDGDGDTDVLVAEFGYLETGSLKLLRNNGVTDDFSVEVLDARHGALGVRIADMDLDGLLDIVVCFGQEFETVEILFQVMPGEYRREVIYRLPGPSYNSSSFELADLDGDGLLDIVHTNGDTLDTFMAKPYYGVRLIRNAGEGVWVNQELGLLVGALHSVVCDFDGDGDLDIAAVAMYPGCLEDGPGAYDSVCWWEQDSAGNFKKHSIERDSSHYACCAAIDIDSDGMPDLVSGVWGAKPPVSPLKTFINGR